MNEIDNSRNYGIDLLRMVSMIMVVTLHILGHGGVLGSSVYLSNSYNTAWLMETMAYCAINCFVIISGYVGVDRQYNLKSIFSLWTQVLFYSVGITFIIGLWNPKFLNITVILKAFLPVTTEQYWFFNSYVGLYLFMPFLNSAINTMERNKLGKYVLCLVLGISVYSTIIHTDVFKTNWGYSTIWFIVLYVVGAYLKKCREYRTYSNKVCLFVYFIMIFLSWFAKLFAEFFWYYVKHSTLNGNLLINYVSPTILLAAVALVKLFSRLKIKGFAITVVKKLSPAAFGVYLIHDHSIFREVFITDRFQQFSSYPTLMLIISVVFVVLIVYFSCSLIDLARKMIFDKLSIIIVKTRLLLNK